MRYIVTGTRATERQRCGFQFHLRDFISSILWNGFIKFEKKMRKIIVIFVAFFAFFQTNSFGLPNSCPGGNETCKPYFLRPLSNMGKDRNMSRNVKEKLLCKAGGKPEPNFTWKKGEVDLNNPKDTFIIEQVQHEDIGTYSCSACNVLGCANFTFQLRIRDENLEFRQSLENATVKIGQKHKFYCIADIIGGTQGSVDWFPHTKEQLIPGENLTEDMAKAMTDLVTSETYEIHSVSKEDEGWYACRIFHNGKTINSTAYLTVESDDSSGVFLMSASLITSLSIVFGFLLYYRKYRKSKSDMFAMTNMHSYMRKVLIREEPNSEEKFEITIEKHFISSQNDDNESGNVYEMANYEIPTDEIWDVPRESVQLAEKIGEGAFGIVYRAKAELKPNTTTIVAVKMLKDNHEDDDGLVDLVSEMQMMKMIGKHRNIINLQGRCIDGQLWVLMEYAALGNLQNFLRNRRYTEVSNSDGYTTMVNTLDEPMLLGFARQIADAMNFLASKNCIHRDLAARNVLVTEDHVMKVADFGLSRYTRDKDYYHKEDPNGRVPFKWMAPESLYHQRYTVQSDVWSFGIVLWEIMSMGAAPYGAMSNLEVYDQIKKGLRMSKPETCSIKTYRLMLACWSYEAQERPNFSKILEELDRIIGDFDEGRSTSTVSDTNSIHYDSSSDSEDEMIVESSLYDVPLISDAPVIVVH